MNDARVLLITWSFALIPYALVAWGYKKLTGGDDRVYWTAFGVLIAVRLFFAAIETLGGILAWRFHDKGVAVRAHLKFLRDKKFPQRTYAHDDLANYLARIAGDTRCAAETKVAALLLENSLAINEQFGVLKGARMHAAAEEALDLYSPRAKAPILKSEF